jgi:hypothetical protein
MSIEHKEILGDLTIASGHGAPTHAAPAGSWYADVDTGLIYINRQVDAATTAWITATATGAAVVATGVTTSTLAASGAVTVVLPTSDPEVVDQLWSNAGAVKVSAGPVAP